MRRSLILTCSAYGLMGTVALAQTAPRPPAGAGVPPPGTLPPQTAPANPAAAQSGVAAGATPAPGAIGGGVVPPSSAGTVVIPSGSSVGSAGAIGGATGGTTAGTTSAGSIGGATGTAIGGATGAGPGSATGAAVGGTTPVQEAQGVQNTLNATTTQPLAPPPLVIPAPPGGTVIQPSTPSALGQGATAAQPIENIGSGPISRRRSATGTQDDALTTEDHRLLETVRQTVLPRLGISEEATPVHFILRNGVVILVGNVSSDHERHQLLSAVRQTPGVISVVDELQMGTAAVSTNVVTAGKHDSIVNPSPAFNAGSLTPTGRERLPATGAADSNSVTNRP